MVAMMVAAMADAWAFCVVEMTVDYLVALWAFLMAD
jgi:hypothetical protein